MGGSTNGAQSTLARARAILRRRPPFSLGVLFHPWRRLPYQNFIWHLFVIGGATAHSFSVIYFVRPIV
jgi:hypothetical protein